LKTCPNCGQITRDDDRFCSSCGQPTDPRRQSSFPGEDRARRPATSGVMSVTPYALALRRFWWVLAVGLVFALLAALSARFSISLFPPGFDEKEEVTYTASSRLLVSSAESPYFRSQTTFVPDTPAAGNGGTGGGGSTTGGEEGASTQPTIPFISPPDLTTLIRTANLYPLFIESDPVADFRRRQYGDLPGSVSATGIYAVRTANRVELSEIPVIELAAVGGSPDEAVALADKTAKAFIAWLKAQQDEAKILPDDRIVIQQLTVPRGAIASAGPSTTLPILVFLIVFAAFCVLAILLDRLLPPGQPRTARKDVEPFEPVKVKKTA
jgi:hypothetical protein